MLITFVVNGTPAPQGSKTAFVNKRTGRAQMVEVSGAVKPWRQDVRFAAAEAMSAAGLERPLSGPLGLTIAFTKVRPRAHYRTGRNAHLLRDDAPTWKATSPDLSKLVRSTEDAITSAGLWEDDRLVARYDITDKWGETSGATITIETLEG